MMRIDASPIAAEVVNLKTVSNRADQTFIGPSCCTGRCAGAVPYATHLEPSIAVTVSMGPPLPTTIGESVDFSPEAMRNGKLGEHRKLTPFGAVQPEVYSPRGCFPL